MEAADEAVDQRWSTARVEAFSDGVFAIAITLLVLEIQIPEPGFADLWRALADEWPSYLAYVTSFLTVGGVWLAHHNLFTSLRFVDPVMMRLNVLLLLVAAFLPFPTGLIAEAFHASREAERAAVIVYGAVALVIELLVRAMWAYAVAHPELVHGDRPAPPQHAAGGAAVSGGLYALALVLGVLVLPRLAAVGYLAVAIRGVFLVGGEGVLTLRHVAGD